MDFDIPDVIYHGEWDNRHHTILSRLPDQTLAEAWPTMDETLRLYYVGCVAGICKSIAKWKGDSISSVDGRELADAYLARNGSPNSFAPQKLLEHCTRMGMNTSSKPVLYHGDLGPTNILVDPLRVPLQLSTGRRRDMSRGSGRGQKFHLSSGMDFPNTEESWKSDWRRLVARKLGELGSEEVVDA